PDFLAAVNDLTAARCTALDEELVAPEGVYCQSVGSALLRGGGGKFPLNFSYHYVKRFDGSNDGLVSAKSFHWGENYSFLRPPHDQGISHGDMIDLNRENIDGFDVREFYVSLVSELKDRGL
ncbi:MAG: triacylglycerol lipase, partial [Oscillospiraceae bacterium]|nr:triacylglycerol lipase [Oscillospiraceae bacterium]